MQIKLIIIEQFLKLMNGQDVRVKIQHYPGFYLTLTWKVFTTNSASWDFIVKLQSVTSFKSSLFMWGIAK